MYSKDKIVLFKELPGMLQDIILDYFPAPRNENAAVCIANGEMYDFSKLEPVLLAGFPPSYLQPVVFYTPEEYGVTTAGIDHTRLYVDWNELVNPECKKWLSQENTWGDPALEAEIWLDEEEDRELFNHRGQVAVFYHNMGHPMDMLYSMIRYIALIEKESPLDFNEKKPLYKSKVKTARKYMNRLRREKGWSPSKTCLACWNSL